MKAKKITREVVLKLTSLVSNISFGLVHIFYLILFLINHAWIMAGINVGSITIYIIGLILILFKKYRIFSTICGLEITIYMTVATMILGYNSGFWICLIGMCILAFVSGYFFRKQAGGAYMRFVACIVFFICYIFLYFYCKNVDSYYHLNPTLERALFIFHSIIVFVFVIAFMFVLTDYVNLLENRITRESETDKLTEIANRNALNNYYEKIKNQIGNYLIAIFDIDDFKKFNDVNGHLCGDFVLKEIAKIAKENSYNDLVSRWGGEEFVVVSLIEGDIDQTINKIDNIRKMISEHKFLYGNKKLHSTITIGVTICDSNKTLDELINLADKKLYKGKKEGKNKTVFEVE